MISAFEDPAILSNGGVHALTASFIYTIPIEEVSEEKGSSGFNDNLSQRDIGKRANHALNYRMGVDTFAEAADITPKQARLIRNRYLDQIYPMVKRGYWHHIEKSLRDLKGVRNLFGMCAYLPQSSVAYMIREWALREIYNNPKRYKGVELLMQVHDSIVFQLRDAISLDHHVSVIKHLVESLERPLHFEDREWL
jgi:DNA polymerase I-like protein with 3'-5' exonuclease and polymerase domains